MNTTNPPSSAATARALDATQSLKRSVQAAFVGTNPFYFTTFFSICLPLRKSQISINPSWEIMPLIDPFLEFTYLSPPVYSNSTASDHSDSLDLPESHDAKRLSPNNGYTSKVKVLDRYKVVGFISSGTYGRVYKAVGHNGQSGEFAIKKCVYSAT